MEIKINNHPVDFEIQEEKKISDVVDSIIEWSNERDLVLSGIEMEGEFHQVDELPDREMDDLEYMNFIIDSKADVVFASVDEGARYCDRALKFIEKVTGGQDFTMEELQYLPSGIDWIKSVTDSVLTIMGIDQTSFQYKGKSISDYMVDMESHRDLIAGLDDIESVREYFRTNDNVFAELKEMLRLLLLSEEMRKLILHSVDSPDVIISSLVSLRESLPGELQNIEDIAVAFQAGKDSEGGARLQRFIDFIFGFTRVCHQVAPVFGVDLNDVVVNDISLHDKNRQIQDMLNETIEILENDDFISLSDILEYEIKPSLSDLDSYMDRILALVEIR